MAEQRDVAIWGAISALSNILEGVWVALSMEDDDPVSAMRVIRDKMFAEWDMPRRETPNTPEHYLSGEYGLAYLERFWKLAEARLKDALEDRA